VLKPGGVLAAQWNNIDPRKFSVQKRKLALRRLLRRQNDNTGAAQFLGTAVRRDAVRSALQGEGMDVVAFKGEDTLFCWVWATKR
jgi:hypothetical protein